MEKLFIATRSEMLDLIKEGVMIALGNMQPRPEKINDDRAGTRIEVATRLKISLSKLDQMTKTGELKSFRMGRGVRYKWSVIEEYYNKK